MTAADLFAQQDANRRRSTMLIAGFVMFFAWIGFGGDLVLYLDTRGVEEGIYRHTVPWMGLVATAVAGSIAGYAWRHGPDRVLAATGAVEVVTPVTAEEIRLVNVVEEMSIAAGLPRPRVWIIPDEDPNALATGRDPGSSSVAVTRGLLGLLNRDELQGVVAHEMAHIQNLDVRLMTLLAAMVGALALMSDVARQFLRRGGGRAGRNRKGSPLALVVLMLWLLSLLVAPLVGRLLAMAVSRRREFLADATAAQFTRNPMALASALEKLEAALPATRTISRGAAHLCIVDPGERTLSARPGLVGDVLASHPPLAMRVIRLRGMGYQALKGERPEVGGET